MTAQRLAIRQRAAAVLAAKVPALAGRVFTNRVIPLQHRQLPAAVVYTTGETISLLAAAPVLHRRAARVVVHLVVDGTEAVDDALDALAQDVELAIYRDDNLAGTAADVTLVGVEGPAIEDEGERLIGELKLVWECLYETEVTEKEEPFEDLERVHVEIETHAPRTGPEMVADIELEVATP